MTARDELRSAAGHDDDQRRDNYWRDQLAPYARPSVARSVLDLVTSVVPYLALWFPMYVLFDVSYWLVLPVAFVASGFLLRTFIVFHDCAHGSFMPSRLANTWVGRLSALLTYQAFASWRHHHAVHHGSSGDLDRRGTGDVTTLTIDEYQAAPWTKKLGYRLFRNPVVMFGLGPLWALLIAPRLVSRGTRPRLRNSVIATNLALSALIGSACWLLGWREFLMIMGPVAFGAGAAGVFLFYVQHQFEDVYWERSDRWSYADAALRGSSYLRLPQPFQFFTGNIGLHHVHHLSVKVPNYNLQRAHDENEIFHSVPVLGFWGGVQSIRLKLIDPASGRLVTFREARSLGAPAQVLA
jgi:acyl-lipid omega-6 desaturase (Delta-12 desaturase)